MQEWHLMSMQNCNTSQLPRLHKLRKCHSSDVLELCRELNMLDEMWDTDLYTNGSVGMWHRFPGWDVRYWLIYQWVCRHVTSHPRMRCEILTYIPVGLYNLRHDNAWLDVYATCINRWVLVLKNRQFSMGHLRIMHHTLVQSHLYANIIS